MKQLRLSGENLVNWRCNPPCVVTKGKIKRLASKKDAERKQFQEEGEDCKVVPFRAAFQNALSLEHERARIMMPNGKVVAYVRPRRLPADPSILRSPGSHRMIQADPASCQCKDFPWTNLEHMRGGHHPLCEFYQGPVPEIQHPPRPAPKAMTIIMAPKSEPKNPEPLVDITVNDSELGVYVAIPNPEDCECKNYDWSGVKNLEGHHPACQYYEAWKVSQSGRSGTVVDLRTGNDMREATVEEIEEAEAALSKTGAPIIRIGDEPYAVRIENG